MNSFNNNNNNNKEIIRFVNVKIDPRLTGSVKYISHPLSSIVFSLVSTYRLWPWPFCGSPYLGNVMCFILSELKRYGSAT